MSFRLRLLLTITFLESFSTILVERGVYFYSDSQLGFSSVHNLWLALGIGAFYAIGAMLSHRLTVRLGERALLLALMLGHLICHVALFQTTWSPAFFTINFLLALFTGMKWPVIESYISAGLTPRESSRAIGSFNISWSVAVPLSLLLTGQMLQTTEMAPRMFLVAAAINVLTMLLMIGLEKHPVHLPLDHPERLSPEEVTQQRALMIGSRWSMLSSYLLLFILVPLLPEIFGERLQLDVAWATTLAAMMDAPRALSFIVLSRTQRWHNRADMLMAAVLGLPIGFFMVLLGPNLATVLAGEMVFGLCAGLVYYSALYYALVIKNASVDAGGEHEGLIGLGFALGPAAGLVSMGLSGFLGGGTAGLRGMAVGLGPMVVVCLIASLKPMFPLVRRKKAR